MELLEKFREFLESVKVSEAVDPEIHAAITVETGLERATAEALLAQKEVVLAGAAGSGKTHLIQSLADKKYELHRLVFWDEKEPSSGSFTRVVPDMTAVSPSDRGKVFEQAPKNCKSFLVAINEGPLLKLARQDREGIFGKSVRMLHGGQAGAPPEVEKDSPTVVDVGGFNPIDAGILDKILTLPLLEDLISSSPCACAPDVCPRRLAWRQLSVSEVRHRVTQVLKLSAIAGGRVSFRELWDFAADLALRGNCEGVPATSSWFWRVFYGDSTLSRRIREAIDPALAVFPKAEIRAWYGDWLALGDEVIQGIELIPPGSSLPYGSDIFDWIKAQLLFTYKKFSAEDLLRQQADMELAKAVSGNDVPEIVAHLNRYMEYGVRAPSRTDLYLWVDLRVERRETKAIGQVSLAEVPVGELEIRHSLAVINHPRSDLRIPGSRTYLVHAKSRASLELSPEVLRLLKDGRSFRTIDREHADLEWQISCFYYQIAALRTDVGTLSVVEFDFGTMTGISRTYRVNTGLRELQIRN